jgi:hypothetical protein
MGFFFRLGGGLRSVSLGVGRENQSPKVFGRLEDPSRFEPALQTPANPRTHQHENQCRVADQERYEKYAAKDFDHTRFSWQAFMQGNFQIVPERSAKSFSCIYS